MILQQSKKLLLIMTSEPIDLVALPSPALRASESVRSVYKAGHSVTSVGAGAGFGRIPMKSTQTKIHCCDQLKICRETWRTFGAHCMNTMRQHQGRLKFLDKDKCIL